MAAPRTRMAESRDVGFFERFPPDDVAKTKDEEANAELRTWTREERLQGFNNFGRGVGVIFLAILAPMAPCPAVWPRRR